MPDLTRPLQSRGRRSSPIPITITRRNPFVGKFRLGEGDRSAGEVRVLHMIIEQEDHIILFPVSYLFRKRL